MPAKLWTDAFMDGMRSEGDPEADEVVAALFAEGGAGAVHRVMRELSTSDGAPSDGLPTVLRDYLACTAALPAADAGKIARGEELFRCFGGEILVVLGFYGLPASYAARKGVQVLHRTAALTRQPIPRVSATARFVKDVMARGGLAPGGRGVRLLQRVRLGHAVVRHMLAHHPARPWDASLGLPLNQEDMAGTLMTFSHVVLDGLARLGVALTREDREAYLHVWQVAGHVLGVREELIPADVAEAQQLTGIIHRRQIAPSPEGRALTAALVEGYQGLLPGPLKGVPASLIHFFLERDPFDGRNVAEMLGVPRPDWTGQAARLAVGVDVFLAQRGLALGLCDKVLARRLAA